MDINQIMTIAVGAVAGLYILLGILWGLKRGLMRSVNRLITIVIAAVAAYFITVGGIQKFGPQLQDFAQQYISKLNETLADVSDASASLIAYVGKIACGLVAPLVYGILFFVLRILLWIVYALLNLFLPSKKKHPIKGLSRLGGVIVSCGGAAVIIISLLAPVVGYVVYAGTLLPEVEETGLVEDGLLPEDIENGIAGAKDNKAIALVNKFGGEFLFNKLITAQDLDPRDEISVLLRLVPAAKRLTEINFDSVFGGEGELDLSAIKDPEDGLIAIMGESDQLKTILAELLSAAGTKWLRGEAFLSINLKETLPENYANGLDGVLARLSTTNADRVGQDLTDLADTMAVIADAFKYLSSMSSAEMTLEDMQANLGNILKDLTPGSAELFAEAISGELIGETGLDEESAAAVSSLLSSSIIAIAELSEEEREQEAAAINSLMSYATGSAEEELTPDMVVDDVLSSKALQSVIVAQSESETPPEIEVSEEQKAEIDDIINDKMTTATEEEKATLEALRKLLVAPTGD